MLAALVRSSLVRCSLVGLAVASAAAARPAAADDLRDHAASLNVIPADAAVYLSWLRNGEQIEAVRQSAAWRKLMTIPAVQMGLMQVQTQWQFSTDERLIAFKEWLATDQAQQAVELAKGMCADEVVLYVDGTLTDLLELLVEVNSLSSRGQVEMLEQLGEDAGLEDLDGDEASESIIKNLFALLDERREEIKAPTVVLAFRIDQADAVKSLLDYAEEALEPLLAQIPAPMPLAERLDRFTRDEADLLTFTLDASMLPWDEMAEEMDDNPEAFEAVKTLVEDQTIVVAAGRVRNFFVVSAGPSIDHFIEEDDNPLLVDTPEMQRLASHAGERLTSIGYVSGDLMRAANSNEQSFEDLAAVGKAALQLVELEEEQKEAIKADIDEVKTELLKLLPEPGAVAATTFMTDRGFETFTYNWAGVAASAAESAPLTLIDHLGEDSLGWFVSRGAMTVEGYDKLVDYLKRAFDHFEAIGEKQAPIEEWDQYALVRDMVMPVLGRLHTTTREMLIPAMADGQGAVVLDASISDERWCDFMAEAPSELPLPTVSLLYGVSDAELLKQGAAECFDITQSVIDLASEMSQGEFPGYELPEPTVADTTGGTLYSYALPGEWGASNRLAPHACLGESVVVLGVLPELSEGLLAGAPPALDGPIDLMGRPAVSAGHFRIAKTLDLIDPWTDFAIQTAIEKGGPDAAGAITMVGMFRPQVDLLLDVLKVFDSWTVVTYREDDAWVTHAETRIIDLDE